MKRPFYIVTPGKLVRKQNTIHFVPAAETSHTRHSALHDLDYGDDEINLTAEDGRYLTSIPIPVEDIEAFYVFGSVTFNSRFLDFLGSERIPLHVFNYYGFYRGTYQPREYLHSGHLMVQQVHHVTDPDLRVDLARRLVRGSLGNMIRTLRYYSSRDADCGLHIDYLIEMREKLDRARTVAEVMGLEGTSRHRYYDAIPLITRGRFPYTKRERNPPQNAINALLSFGNSLIYTLCLSEIYRTQLSPLISFLHEPGERRYSLALDLADVFKPLLSDRILFKLVNNRQIQESHFEKDTAFCYLTEEGRKVFIQEYDEKLQTTIMHRTLDKAVSYRRLVRLECYKLIKHLNGEEPYEPFVAWW